VKFLPTIDDEERILAALALGRIGKAVVPAVEPFLDHEDETTRYYALWTIGLVGKDAKGLTPRVLKMLQKDDDEEVRTKAMFTLTRIAPDSPEVLAALTPIASKTQNYSGERLTAIEELRHLGPPAIEPLVKSLSDLGVSGQARESLNHILDNNKTEACAKAVIPHLGAIFLTPDFPGIDPTSGEGLGYILSKHGDKLLPLIEKQLQDKDTKVQGQGVVMLGHLLATLQTRGDNNDLAKRIIKMVLPYAKDRTPAVRQAFASIVPINDDTQAAFEELLMDGDPNVFMFAFNRFQNQGVDPAPKIRKRFAAAKGEDRLRPAMALYGVSRDAAAADLLWPNVKHKDPAIRHQIACTLASRNFGPVDDEKTSKVLIPILLESLKSKNVHERDQAADLLAQNQPLRGPHVAALYDRLDDSSSNVKRSLLGALIGHAGADAKKFTPKLVGLLDDPEDDVRSMAILAMNDLGKDIIPGLTKMLAKEKQDHLWTMACERLGRFGADAKDAVPVILKSATSPERHHMATDAVLKIAPDQFAAIWEQFTKNDARLGKIALDKDAQKSSIALRDAVLAEWKKADGARRRDLAYVQEKVMLLLPMDKRYDTAKKFAPILTQELASIDKAMASKEVATRVNAVKSVAGFRQLWQELQMSLFADPKGVDEKLVVEYQKQGQQFEDIVRKARADSDLQVRREGRKADINIAVGPFPLPGPGIRPFPFAPFGPGFRGLPGIP
jgi:HEAT repeat protein